MHVLHFNARTWRGESMCRYLFFAGTKMTMVWLSFKIIVKKMTYYVKEFSTWHNEQYMLVIPGSPFLVGLQEGIQGQPRRAVSRVIMCQVAFEHCLNLAICTEKWTVDKFTPLTNLSVFCLSVCALPFEPFCLCMRNYPQNGQLEYASLGMNSILDSPW